ncbi:MAG: hypothetical protein D3923_13045, partial [Candidatus Electrothrix sp. AR3]|nr:hypothetical protein [Candidatus Electrothrix sp. AR3]
MKNPSFSWKYGIFFFFLGAFTGSLVTWQCLKRPPAEQPEQKKAEQEVPKQKVPEQQIAQEQEQEEIQSVRAEITLEPSTCLEQPIEIPLHKIVADLEAQTLLYGVGPLTDCSGIFHRVLKGMKQQCHDQEYPTVEKYRSSRDLLRWYFERDEVVLIEDVVTQSDLITPGTVLFYGQSGSSYQNFTAEDLIKPYSGVDHVGVVVSVRKNEAGEVISYQLFHGYGKRGQTAASTTDWHKRTPTQSIYPPFGNGRQQWVALARLLSPKKSLYIDHEQTKAEQELLEQKIAQEPEQEEIQSVQQAITLEP